MEFREIRESYIRHLFSVEGLTEEQIKAWAYSPITRAFMHHLPKDGVLLALQYDKDRAMVHFLIPLDVKKAIEETGEPIDIDTGARTIIKKCGALEEDYEHKKDTEV